jgi:predicted nucleic acid-binding protein
MRYYVLDASVTLKWFFADREDEAFTQHATELLLGAHQQQFCFLQPPHWLAEVAAVLAREIPTVAMEEVSKLYQLSGYAIVNEPQVYALACDLAMALNHHLFDTLYHAVALHRGVPLITADDRYYRKAVGKGGTVIHLADFGKDDASETAESPKTSEV